MKEKMRLGRLWACILTLTWGLNGVSLSAQDEASSPASEDQSTESSAQSEVSAPDASRDELTWSIGAGFIASPRPYIDTKAKVFPIPAIGLNYKRWFVQGIRGGYSFIQSDRWTGNLFAQARFRGLEPDDSPFLEGMEERKKSMDAGIELIYSGRPVGFRASVLTDTLGRSNGQEVSLLAVTGVPLGRRGLVLVGFGPRWLSQNRVDYYYGVRANEATTERPVYTGEATWNLDLNVTTIINLTSRWSFLALLNREALGSGIKNSPLIERESAFGLVTSLNYRF